MYYHIHSSTFLITPLSVYYSIPHPNTDNPPIPLNTIDTSEKALPPHNNGSIPPTVEPIAKPIMMIVFSISVSLYLLYYKQSTLAIQKINLNVVIRLRK